MEATTIATALEDLIKQAMAAQAPRVELVPLAQFCQDKKISRTTVWRAEKRGELKLTRIGSRVFVNVQQFTTL